MADSAKTISAELLDKKRDSDDFFLLDVRREEDFEDWRIEGAKNIDVYDDLLDEDFDSLENNLDQLPEDKEIGIVCVGGVTSGRAAQYLEDNYEYDVASLRNGMREWGRYHKHIGTDIDGVEQVIRPGTGCISHILHDNGEALIVDPSNYIDEYMEILDELEAKLIGTIDTHAHADHISGGPFIQSTEGVNYYLHGKDSRQLTNYTEIEDGDTIKVGNKEVQIMYTPGHTPGSISIIFDNALLSGDTLFLDSVGRPDLEGDDEEETKAAARKLFDSLKKFKSLSNNRTVLPGHFSNEKDRPLARSIKSVRKKNELFREDDKEKFVNQIINSLSETPDNYKDIKKINWGIESIDEDSENLELGPNNCAAD